MRARVARAVAHTALCHYMRRSRGEYSEARLLILVLCGIGEWAQARGLDFRLAALTADRQINPPGHELGVLPCDEDAA